MAADTEILGSHAHICTDLTCAATFRLCNTCVLNQIPALRRSMALCMATAWQRTMPLRAEVVQRFPDAMVEVRYGVRKRIRAENLKCNAMREPLV